MVRVSPAPLLAIFGFLLSCLLLHSPALAKVKWKEIDKALLAEAQGIVDPGAPSETVDWEVQLIDSYDGKGFRSEVVHYRRVKIFNDRGRELEGTIEIPYAQGERIYDVAGRTIRPNGTVVELQKEAVFDRTTVKARRLKGKAKSFAMPGVEPGAVIEYQWTSVRRDEAVLILYAQRPTPVRSMTMVLTPVTDPDVEMRVRSFNMKYPEPEKLNRTMTIHLEGIRGHETEPYMPPDDQVRPWLLIDYIYRQDKRSTDEFWKETAKTIYKVWKPNLDVTPPVRRTADSLTAGTVDFSERIRVLHDFCRTRIRSVYDDAYDFTDEFRTKLLEDEKRMPEETLRHGYGTDADINLLFAALAQAAGFKSRFAFVADRSEIFFRRENRLPFQLSEDVVAIEVSGEWKFYDPAVRDMPAGMLPWWEESQVAMILDPKEPEFATTQLSLPSRSLARRVGRLRLKEDGTLEGEVRETYTGHLGQRRKEEMDERSVNGRMEEVRKQLRTRWASAVVESLALTGMDHPIEPYALTYRISVPDYAERAGKRLLLQPDLFERGGTPVFTASTRRHWLYFPFPWSEEDSVTIDLPEGYEVEADAAPAPLSVGRTIAHRVAFEVDDRVLRLHRYLAFGMDGTILIDPADYDRVKKSFESIHKRDGYTVTLRPVEAAAR